MGFHTLQVNKICSGFLKRKFKLFPPNWIQMPTFLLYITRIQLNPASNVTWNRQGRQATASVFQTFRAFVAVGNKARDSLKLFKQASLWTLTWKKQIIEDVYVYSWFSPICIGTSKSMASLLHFLEMGFYTMIRELDFFPLQNIGFWQFCLLLYVSVYKSSQSLQTSYDWYSSVLWFYHCSKHASNFSNFAKAVLVCLFSA